MNAPSQPQGSDYRIAFQGKGLEELRTLAREMNLPEGEVVLKALRLLKATYKRGQVTVREGDTLTTIDPERI